MSAAGLRPGESDRPSRRRPRASPGFESPLVCRTVRYPPAAVRQLPGSILTPVDRNERSAPEEAAMRLSLHRTIAGLALILTAAANGGGALASSTPAPDWFERAINRHLAETQSATVDAHQRAGGTRRSRRRRRCRPARLVRAGRQPAPRRALSAPLDAHRRVLFGIRLGDRHRGGAAGRVRRRLRVGRRGPRSRRRTRHRAARRGGRDVRSTSQARRSCVASRHVSSGPGLREGARLCAAGVVTASRAGCSGRRARSRTRRREG